MANMEVWDVVLLVAAGYVALTTLVRLMLRRRDERVGRFRKEVEREQRRRSDRRQREVQQERAA